MNTSKRANILDAIKTQLTTDLTWANTVDWANIRILSSDFGEHELPVVQFYHMRTDYISQQGRIEANMVVNVEVCLKSSTSGVVDQRDLFDKMEDVILSFGGRPNLGISGVIHARLLTDETDVHSIKPFFIGSLVFEVKYFTTYTGC